MSPIAAPPPLNLVVAWLPDLGERSWRFVDDAPTALPALLYGDKITLVCKWADDLMELEDFSELVDAFGGIEDFDNTVELISMDGLSHTVWEPLADDYARAARDAIVAGDRTDATRQLARIFGLSYYDFGSEEYIKQTVQAADGRMMREAEKLWPSVMDREVTPDQIAWIFEHAVAEPDSYGVVDDPGQLLTAGSRAAIAAELDRWVRNRAIEAELGVEVLRRLPTPAPREQPWMVVAELRRQLRGPLQRFRLAIARLAQTADLDPLNEHDITSLGEAIFRTEIVPALEELQEMTHDASLRSIFVADVAADPYSYVGPSLGLIAAFGAAVPVLIAAAVGATTPVARGLSHARDRRSALRKHDYLFFHEAQRTLTDR